MGKYMNYIDDGNPVRDALAKDSSHLDWIDEIRTYSARRRITSKIDEMRTFDEVR